MQTDRANNLLLVILLGLAILLFLLIMKPFFFPLFWAAVIASIFRPFYKWVNGKLKRPNLSSTIVLVLIILIIILPAGIVGSLLLTESLQIYQSLSIDSSQIEQNIQGLARSIINNPLFSSLHLKQSFWIEKFAGMTKGVLDYILKNLSALTQNTLAFFVKFAVMLYALFFFIRDGQWFLDIAMRALPLSEDKERLLYERFAATARSTLKVTLLIGGIQGILGGLIFFATGIQGPIVWGVIMIFTAIVPAVGCSIIWAPAGILMLINGHIYEGVVILLFGMLIISSVDNVLRPILVGKDVQMHPLLIFLSTLGGIILFGISGFVVGPIITSLLIAIWGMYDQYYKAV
ncbi:MAG: AI-2E family transporter [Deltaproteobacteria bacterium]|nr:AI-2E family transporter [Deltaproteobacteria bacterium]